MNFASPLDPANSFRSKRRSTRGDRPVAAPDKHHVGFKHGLFQHNECKTRPVPKLYQKQQQQQQKPRWKLDQTHQQPNSPNNGTISHQWYHTPQYPPPPSPASSHGNKRLDQPDHLYLPPQHLNNLKKVPCLRELNLAHNQLGDDGVEALSAGLAGHPCLEALILDGNDVGLDGTQALCEALLRNASLRFLALRRNSLLADSAQVRGRILILVSIDVVVLGPFVFRGRGWGDVSGCGPQASPRPRLLVPLGVLYSMKNFGSRVLTGFIRAYSFLRSVFFFF